MTSESLSILLSKIKNVIAFRIVKVIPTLSNWLHLAIALSRDEVVLVLDGVDVFLIDKSIRHVPVGNGSTNVHT
jgi:hypothetical protein